ncbi:MAG TPA: molybdopterin cofactor-binding domain-containing protein, partial [Propylenella sp.]
MGVEGIGARVVRKEDKRFITGRGRFTDDMSVPGMAHAAFVRSPHAHAKIGKIDSAKAAGMPGVIKVLTGAELAADGIGGMPCGFVPNGGPQNSPPRPPLVSDKVRFVGDLVAMVIAETRDQARDAAAAIDVEYQPLPANVDPARAQAADTPLLHAEAPANMCVDFHLGDKDATEAAFKNAARVVELDLINNRKIPNAIEPRSSLGIFDPAAESYALHTTTQNPHITRLLLAAF